MTLPDGSSSRICWPPGPVTMSFRNVAPSARNFSTSAATSLTMRWIRFHPPGDGTVPSGIGRPAELAGPLSSSSAPSLVSRPKDLPEDFDRFNGNAVDLDVQLVVAEADAPEGAEDAVGPVREQGALN